MDLPDSTVSFDGAGMRLDTSEDAETICKEITGKNVQVLILQGNTFGIEAAERIGLELAKQTDLREAHFKDLFTSRGREEVPEAMMNILKGIIDSGAQLTLLDLSDNAIGPIGAPPLIEFLRSSSAETLEKLYLNNCGLGPEGSSSVATTIPNLTKLRELICGRNRLENKGAANMSRALTELNTLEVLKASQNGIRVEGIESLVSVLEANIETIAEIDFSDNTIKPEGARALARIIVRAPNLRVIRLGDALLENEGFCTICEALSKSKLLSTLDELNVEGNELDGNKLVDLIEATFSVCKNTFTLNLLENDFSPNQLVRLQQLESKFTIFVDDIESDYDDDSGDDENEIENSGQNDKEDSGELNGYVDFSNIEVTELREITQDLIRASSSEFFNESLANSTFLELVTAGFRPAHCENNYHTAQVVCEELGLIKLEATRKKKNLARDAILYIQGRVDELPNSIKDFFEAVVKNNDDLTK